LPYPKTKRNNFLAFTNNIDIIIEVDIGGNMPDKKKKLPTQNDILKLEIAKELGLMERVEEIGWGGLTAKETGRIGGLMTAKKKRGKKTNG
jgi:hypothetical protein